MLILQKRKLILNGKSLGFLAVYINSRTSLQPPVCAASPARMDYKLICFPGAPSSAETRSGSRNALPFRNNRS